MSQSSTIIGAILFGFFVFMTVKGQLPTFLGIITGTAAGSSATATAATTQPATTSGTTTSGTANTSATTSDGTILA